MDNIRHNCNMRLSPYPKIILPILVYLIALTSPIKAQEPGRSFWPIVFATAAFLTIQYIFENPALNDEEEIESEQSNLTTFPIESLSILTSTLGL